METVPGVAMCNLSGQGSVREGCCAGASLGADPICVLPREIFVACSQILHVEGYRAHTDSRKQSSCRNPPRLVLYKQCSSTTCSQWEKFGRNVRKRLSSEQEPC